MRISACSIIFPYDISYSSDNGVIFFSSISSSAKFFWYFSQLDPVALGMLIYAATTAACSRTDTCASGGVQG
jgi:hypothetical protein